MRIALLSLLFVSPLAAQNAGPSPAETKLREMVKSLTQRVTQAEADKATLEAEKLKLTETGKDLTKNLEKSEEALKQKGMELSKLREDSAAKEAELNTNIKNLSTELASHKASLEKWRAAHVEISGIARKKESERSKHAAEAAALGRRVDDLRTRNASLYNTGLEILDRLKKFSLGEAIAAREPFTGNMKIKLKNQVQEFADNLLDGTADSKRPAPAPTATKPATPPADAAPLAKPPTPAEVAPPKS
jgi:colicin import membrane protein